MDYGKLAYLKAVDLENRLFVSSERKMGVSVTELKDLPAGDNDITLIEGTGDIAVFANCSVEAVFYVNGVRVCEGKNVFFKLSDSGKISVSSDSAIASLRIMVIGAIVYSESPSEVQADCDGRNIAYIICNNGKAHVYFSELELFSPTEIFSGDYVQGDVCLRGGKTILALVDNKGTISLIEGGRRYLYHVGAERVAINADDFSVTVAFVSGGRLFYFVTSKVGAALPELTRLTYPGYIDDLKLVKRSNMLAFSSAGKCYVKELPMAPGSVRDKLYISLKAEVK